MRDNRLEINFSRFHYLYLITTSFCVHFSPDYNVEFFRKFVLVMNALDNRGIHTS